MATQTNSKDLGKAGNAGKFFKGVKSELKKVIWPNRDDLTKYTTVVLVVCVLAGFGIWVVDTIFGKALQLIIK